MYRFLYIALGGAFGAILRYELSNLTHKHLGSGFPWGTLSVNLIGSFAIGIIWAISDSFVLSEHIKSFVIIGLLGAFTTFSAFAIENFLLFKDNQIGLAVTNILLSNILGIFLVFAGYYIFQYIFKTID